MQEFIKKHINLDIASEMDNCFQFDKNLIMKGIYPEIDEIIEKLDNSENKLKSICNYLSQLIESVEKKPKTSKGKGKEPNNEYQIPDYVNIYETPSSMGIISTSRRCKLLQQMLPNESKKVLLKIKMNNSSNNNTNKEKEFYFNISKGGFEFTKQNATNNYIQQDEVNELCKSISDDKTSIKELNSSVYFKFMEDFQQFQKEMECIIHFVTMIDVLLTKAYIAKKYNYCKPVIKEAAKSFVEIKELRHCLIEYLQTNELYVSNNITLGNGIQDGVLLYGTNAVGKTSFIRSLGISVIMAQSGLYVPATEFVYNPYKYIFTRIIGNDIFSKDYLHSQWR